jgi:hypothetical protein
MRVLILFVVAALAQKSPPLDAQGRPLEKPDKELFNAAIEAMKKLDIDPKEVMTEDKHLDTLKEELPEDQYNAVVLMIKQRPPNFKGLPKGLNGGGLRPPRPSHARNIARVPDPNKEAFMAAVAAAKEAGVHPKDVLMGKKDISELKKALSPEHFETITTSEHFMKGLEKARREHL